MFPFGLQLKPYDSLRHLPMYLEAFDFEREKERDNKIFGIVKIKQDSKKNKKNSNKKEKKNLSSKNKK
jgi:hypothetical protein